jgi:hypothetical protein
MHSQAMGWSAQHRHSEREPVRGVTWLDPRLVAEVTYGDVTPAGVLGAPVFRGFADEGAIRLT